MAATHVHSLRMGCCFRLDSELIIFIENYCFKKKYNFRNLITKTVRGEFSCFVWPAVQTSSIHNEQSRTLNKRTFFYLIDD